MQVEHVAATAERIPVRSRSVDVVVCAQSFHWFDHDLALAEIARVLRPGGVLALVWNTYDTSIPWVRRLERLLMRPDDGDRAFALKESPYFGFVEEKSFRFWQVHNARTLADLARSVSRVATMRESERDELLAQVDALYADYGRGHDGMQLPWVTRCYRAVVRHAELPAEAPAPTSAGGPRPPATCRRPASRTTTGTPGPRGDAPGRHRGHRSGGTPAAGGPRHAADRLQVARRGDGVAFEGLRTRWHARQLGCDADLATFRTLHTASLASPALRQGLNTESVERSLKHLRALLGTAAVAICDTQGLLGYDGLSTHHAGPGRRAGRPRGRRLRDGGGRPARPGLPHRGVPGRSTPSPARS